MSGDIEEFLRRAAQRRQQQAPPKIEIVDADVVEDAEVIDERGGILSGQDVASHVSQHLNTSEYTERLSHFGESIGTADDTMEAHLQEVFEHRLGDLGTMTSRPQDSTLDDDRPHAVTSEEPAKATKGLDIAGMFRAPQSLRTAIILSEIINRPEDRW